MKPAAAGGATLTGDADRGRPKRVLVVLADGTSSAYGGVPTNIWRLYQALDCSEQSGQIARYIPGVGTSSFGLIRVLDAITGLGVPHNVRKLYRFLSWTYQPGDEIWMFGFSRGAFTVRTLAGMIARQGLMPREIDGRMVAVAEMDRNCRGAWRSYRAETAPLINVQTGKLEMAPWISLLRQVRDLCIGLYRGVMRYDSHARVLARRRANLKAYDPDLKPDAAPASRVEVRFIGIFDTVEAYGVPVDELRNAVNWLIWPIRFRNRQCAKMVQIVRHAVALDEERLTFHPVRCERAAGIAGDRQDFREVWFAGSHSDIGGGYPDDTLALEALGWMYDEARAAGLKFRTSDLTAELTRRTPRAATHDSRSGLGALYRYAPRRVEVEPSIAEIPVVHRSVLDKIAIGSDGYAPVVLHQPYKPLTNGTPPLTPRSHAGVTALVLWRAVTDRIMTMTLVLVVVILVAIIPADLTSCADAAPNLPFLRPGLRRDLWGVAALTVVLILSLSTNTTLRDLIKDYARASWAASGLPGDTPKPALQPRGLVTGLIRVGRFLGRQPKIAPTLRAISAFLVPLGLVAILYLAACQTAAIYDCLSGATQGPAGQIVGGAP